MFEDPQGPVQEFDWGRFVIYQQTHDLEGKGAGKDIFVFNGKVKPWQSRKGHRLKPKMVACIKGQAIDVLVIGSGVHGALKIPQKTRTAILTEGVQELIIEKTPQACRVFNRLTQEGKQVALLAHGTC